MDTAMAGYSGGGRELRRKVAMSSQKKLNRQIQSQSSQADLNYRPARRIPDPYQEVMCLTVSQKMLTIYLPYGLEHELAVRTVDDILEVLHCVKIDLFYNSACVTSVTSMASV